jgi:hypothetical protein
MMLRIFRMSVICNVVPISSLFPSTFNNCYVSIEYLYVNKTVIKLLMLKFSGFCHFLQGDTPNHSVEIPVEYRTSFSCVGRVAGYYADISSGCQVRSSGILAMVPEVSTPLTLIAPTC